MEQFFQLIAIFALFFGIAGLVYATEVSKRCQQNIATRMDAIETELARKMHKQDMAIGETMNEMRRTLSRFEEHGQAQTREINALRKAMEPLVKDLEKRVTERKSLAINQ